MSTNNYINQLVKAFNISKDIIKEAKRVPVIITNEAPLKHSKKEVEILESEFLPQITIYSISMEKYCRWLKFSVERSYASFSQVIEKSDGNQIRYEDKGKEE